MERAELILLTAIWWGALSLLAAYGILRCALGVDEVDESIDKPNSPDDAELQREWELHLQEVVLEKEAQPRIYRFVGPACALAMWILVAVLGILFWPLLIGAWVETIFDRWWSQLPIAGAIKSVANLKVKGLSWLDDMHGRPR